MTEFLEQGRSAVYGGYDSPLSFFELRKKLQNRIPRRKTKTAFRNYGRFFTSGIPCQDKTEGSRKLSKTLKWRAESKDELGKKNQTVAEAGDG